LDIVILDKPYSHGDLRLLSNICFEQTLIESGAYVYDMGSKYADLHNFSCQKEEMIAVRFMLMDCDHTYSSKFPYGDTIKAFVKG